MKFKGLIFDMDGTLINSLTFWERMWREVGTKYMGDATFYPDEVVDKKVRTTIYTDAMRFFVDYYKLDVDFDDFMAFAMGEIENFYRTCVTMKEGAKELLDYLRAEGVPMCLASASEMKHIMIAAEGCGLADYFDHILSCNDIGCSKDKPDIYLLALEKLGLTKDEVVVVEDSYVALETAKSIGIFTVGVFDENNYGQDRLSRAADIYLGKGEPLSLLIGRL